MHTTPSPSVLSKQAWQALNDEFLHHPQRHTTLLLFAANLGLLAFSWWVNRTFGLLGLVGSWALLLLAMIQLYLILHEAAHSAVSRTKWVNNLVGNVCGWSFLLPFFSRQRNHLMHHVWTAHPLGDPENAKMISRFSVMTQAEEKKLEFIWKYWLPVITLNHFLGTWRDPFEQVKAGNGSARMVREMRFQKIYAAAYAVLAVILLATGTVGAFAAWFFPPWLVFLAFIELVNLPHHADAPLLDPKAKPLPYWRQAEVSHNCATVPFWSRFIILNFNLHIAHHAFPHVPWYELPALNRRVEGLTGTEPPRFKSEFGWAVFSRRRRLLQVMGHFFDKRRRPPSEVPSTHVEVTS